MTNHSLLIEDNNEVLVKWLDKPKKEPTWDDVRDITKKYKFIWPK